MSHTPSVSSKPLRTLGTVVYRLALVVLLSLVAFPELRPKVAKAGAEPITLGDIQAAKGEDRRAIMARVPVVSFLNSSMDVNVRDVNVRWTLADPIPVQVVR